MHKFTQLVIEEVMLAAVLGLQGCGPCSPGKGPGCRVPESVAVESRESSARLLFY